MRQAESGQLLPMSTPGHKQRYDLVGTVVAGDAPLYGAIAPIKHADRLRADAEARAAALWGADWCRFSVAGSTHGNQAFCLAMGQPGQEVIITRTLHRSLLLGLVMAGLRPVWVRPEVDQGTGLPGAVRAYCEEFGAGSGIPVSCDAAEATQALVERDERNLRHRLAVDPVLRNPGLFPGR
jgi:lysine decarboxylase